MLTKTDEARINRAKKGKAMTAMLAGIVREGWLRECSLVMIQKLGEKHVTYDAQAATVKALAFDLLSARFEK